MPKDPYDFAAWTQFIPESEIRRLLKYNVPYYFGGGKPGALPLETLAKILIELGNEQAVGKIVLVDQTQAFPIVIGGIPDEFAVGGQGPGVPLGEVGALHGAVPWINLVHLARPAGHGSGPHILAIAG